MYRIPPPGNAPSPIDEIRPVISGITIHEHGTELALVLEGSNFWFCNRLFICGESIDTPASKISGTSIKLNFNNVNKPSLNLLSNEQEIVIKIYNHFLKSPSSVKLRIHKKVSNFTVSDTINIYVILIYTGIPSQYKAAAAGTTHPLTADRGDLPQCST